MRETLEGMDQVAELLEAAAVDATFAGGAVLPLLVEPAVEAELRPTFDIDVIVRAADYFEYQERCQALVRAGFQPGTLERDPLCRFRRGDLVVDLMPTPYEGLGMNIEWFALGLETAEWRSLPSGRRVRVLSAPVYLATKIAAFRDRGSGDYYGAKDFEDIIALVDGRPILVEECSAQGPLLLAFVCGWVADLLSKAGHRDYVEGVVSRGGGPDRGQVVLQRLRALVALNPS